MKLFFDDVGFDGQLQRSVGKCDAGMANVRYQLSRSPGVICDATYRHSPDSPRAYFGDMRRYNCVEQAPKITGPSYVTDNETDPVSTGQGEELFNALTCPKEFRRFLQKEGAEGHCEGMAPVVFWTAAFDWLESTLA
jgi:hypothetical protein